MPDGSAAPGELLGRSNKISGDGRVFAFSVSSAEKKPGEAYPEPGEVYLRDTATGVTTRITPELYRSQSLAFAVDQVTSDGAYVSVTEFRVGDFSATSIYDVASNTFVLGPFIGFRGVAKLSREGDSFSFDSIRISKAIRNQLIRTISDDGSIQYSIVQKLLKRRMNEVLTVPRTGRTYVARRILKSGESTTCGYQSKRGSYKPLIQCRYGYANVGNPSADGTRVLIGCEQDEDSFANILLDLQTKKSRCLETGKGYLDFATLSDDGSTVVARLNGKIVIYKF